MAELEEILSRVPLFAGLEQRDLKRLAGRMSERTWSEGETVLKEGAGGAGFWVIEDGKASVNAGGKVVRELGAGEFFGEIALLDDGPRTATVTAATELKCRGIVAWEFAPFVKENPEVAWPLLQTLARRLREAGRSGDD